MPRNSLQDRPGPTKPTQRKVGTRKGPRAAGSEHEQAALFIIRQMGLPEPAQLYQFCGARRWKADFCWKQPRKVLLEVEGGQWKQSTYVSKRTGKLVTRIGGRHNTGEGFSEDCLKYSTAASLGWLVIRVTPAMIRDGTMRKLLEKVFE